MLRCVWFGLMVENMIFRFGMNKIFIGHLFEIETLRAKVNQKSI